MYLLHHAQRVGLLTAALAACLVLAAGNVHAATIQLVGNTVTYEYDDSLPTNVAALALLGAPTIVGDVVRFLPPDFRAQSVDGEGTVTATATFIFDRVFTDDTLLIDAISVAEFGDYKIDVGDEVTLDLDLLAENNKNLTETTSDSASLLFTGDSGGLQTWMTTASVFPGLALPTSPTDVKFTITNTLTATTDASGEVAWIQKKLAFVASTTVIPVPAAVWLFGSALGLLGVARRRVAKTT